MPKRTADRIAPGQVIGRWTVLNQQETTAKGEIKRLCRCECGTERFVLERSLLYGGSQSCGCLTRERSRQRLSHNLRGITFGDLTVLERASSTTRGVMWKCRCTCGNICEVPATLLATGKRTHCGCKAQRHYAFKDITNQRFHHLTALYPLSDRDAKGNVIWHCRCECGNEIDVSYNLLAYSNQRSCGCLKKEHSEELRSYLIHVDGTSLNLINSQKLPKNNTTGVKGVYFIRGKYVAKIVLQHRQFVLGSFERLEKAAEVRRQAEETLRAELGAYWEKWQQKASADPQWAEENPVRLEVEHQNRQLSVKLLPELS